MITLSLSGWMLYMMYAVLIAMGLDILAGLYKALMSNSLSLLKLSGFLQGVLHYVFPLLIVASVTAIDPTGIVAMIAYYLGALGVVVKYLNDIRSKVF